MESILSCMRWFGGKSLIDFTVFNTEDGTSPIALVIVDDLRISSILQSDRVGPLLQINLFVTCIVMINYVLSHAEEEPILYSIDLALVTR